MKRHLALCPIGVSSLARRVFRLLIIGFAATLATFAGPTFNSAAADRPSFDVWPNRPPGVGEDEPLEVVSEDDPRIGERVKKVTKPRLTVYQPAADKANGAAIVICPGGGYNILALDLEGTEVAEWLNGIGVTAFVLHYRVPRAADMPKHALPLKDAQRAVSLVRHRAKEWNVDPAKIGILGFSAGGHLAASASTNFDRRSYDAVDDADEISCRPDFSVLIYPAYLTGEKGELGVKLTDEIPVGERTPPAIMIHAQNDPVTCNSSIAYFLALKERGIPAELHVYPSGGHGYGLRPSEHAVSAWPDRVARWLQSVGAVSIPSAPSGSP